MALASKCRAIDQPHRHPKRGKSARSDQATEAATVAQAALADGSITAKIKAKMTLDDTVQASNIHVDYNAGVVTLAGP
jgi:osmotically-inducible protein OsmY